MDLDGNTLEQAYPSTFNSIVLCQDLQLDWYDIILQSSCTAACLTAALYVSFVMIYSDAPARFAQLIKSFHSQGLAADQRIMGLHSW